MDISLNKSCYAFSLKENLEILVEFFGGWSGDFYHPGALLPSFSITFRDLWSFLEIIYSHRNTFFTCWTLTICLTFSKRRLSEKQALHFGWLCGLCAPESLTCFSDTRLVMQPVVLWFTCFMIFIRISKEVLKRSQVYCILTQNGNVRSCRKSSQSNDMGFKMDKTFCYSESSLQKLDLRCCLISLRVTVACSFLHALSFWLFGLWLS